MLYLVSGASRSGKTHVARKLMAERQIPYLSTDWLMMGFNDGMPENGIHHLLWPDEIARKMWPFLCAMIDNMLFDGMDYVIEGEAMLPELVAELVKSRRNDVKVVFVGYADVDVAEKVMQVTNFCNREDDWLISQSDAYIEDHIRNMVSYSRMLKTECARWDLPYFDTSQDFVDTMARVKDFLVGNPGGPA